MMREVDYVRAIRGSRRGAALAFFYDSWNLIAEVNAQTGELIRTYVWGLDLSGTMQGAGGIGGLLWINKGMIEELYFIAYDGEGNVVRLLNGSNGDVSAQYEYGPYREPIRENGSMAQENPIRFRTMYFERETHCFYGYYDTINGRFIISRKVFEKHSAGCGRFRWSLRLSYRTRFERIRNKGIALACLRYGGEEVGVGFVVVVPAAEGIVGLLK